MIDDQHVSRAINRAEEAAAALREAARHRTRGSGDYITGTPEAPTPLRLDLFDQAEQIHYCIQGWARMVEEETADPLPADQTATLALYLRQHAGWIAEQAWADELVLELRDETHTAEGMLGTLPRRIPLPTPCECGQEQWGYPGEGEGGMAVECVNGHVRTLHQASGGARVSIRGAQRVLGIGRVTIREALASGMVQNHGTEHRPILDTREVETYLRERLRTHKV